MKAHRIELLPDEIEAINHGYQTLAMVHPAKPEDVKRVLAADESSDDGRSPWVWVRLMNGDLVLGVFPQGDTYCEMEAAAQYPGDEK